MWLFYFFKFERNYDVLKSKSHYFLLKKKANGKQNEIEKTNRETNLMLQLI